MKEYRLKKWYPSLNSSWKGENIVVVEKEYYYHLHPSLRSKELSGIMGIEKGDVENNPEFWEEIKPVKEEYEIIGLKADDNIFDKTNLNRWYRRNGKDDGYYPNLKAGSRYAVTPLEIYSVKRLSDGEIFTVGDNIVPPARTHEFYKHKKYPIKSFVTSQRLYGDEKPRAIVENGCHLLINELKHEKSLFQTEDGVDIYEDDRVFAVSPYNLTQGSCYISENVHPKSPTVTDRKYKIFSTKEAAEDYALLNVRRFTLNEVAEVLHDISHNESMASYVNEVYKTLKSKYWFSQGNK